MVLLYRARTVCGAGSLYLYENHTIRLLDTPEFSKEYLPVKTAAAKSLDELRLRNDVKWSFFSPAAIFDADGSRTGKYILGGEVAKFNEQGTVTLVMQITRLHWLMK